MGNFQYRLTTAINLLAQHIIALNQQEQVEIVITDWNSDIPLATTLPLTPEAAQLCHFICVPPAVAAATTGPSIRFHGALATNVALRRARGRFIMLFDADCLMTRASVEALLQLVNGSGQSIAKLEQTFFFCGRYQIPWEVVQRQPTLVEWERYLALNSGQLPPDSKSYGLGIFGIGLMMHRTLWFECRGYDESMPGWGWVDADLMLRISQRYAWIDLASSGVVIFHMEHYGRTRRATSGHSINPYIVSYKLAANDENWGLGLQELEWQVPQVTLNQSRQQSTQTSAANVIEQLLQPDIQHHLQSFLIDGNVPSHEWGSLYALAWYALKRYPRNYVEFGIANPYAALLVVAACSGVELYGIDDWQPNRVRPAPPPSYITSLLDTFNYRGYARYLSGDLNTAFQRLSNSFIGPMALDLVFVRAERLTQPVEVLQQIIPRLAPGGALVFTHTDMRQFTLLSQALQGEGQSFTLIQSHTKQTGIVLMMLKDDVGTVIEEQLNTAWQPIRFNRSQTIMWQKRIASVWGQVKDLPPHQWWPTLSMRWQQFKARWISHSSEPGA